MCVSLAAVNLYELDDYLVSPHSRRAVMFFALTQEVGIPADVLVFRLLEKARLTIDIPIDK